jgi:restriction endonuclease
MDIEHPGPGPRPDQFGITEKEVAEGQKRERELIKRKKAGSITSGCALMVFALFLGAPILGWILSLITGLSQIMGMGLAFFGFVLWGTILHVREKARLKQPLSQAYLEYKNAAEEYGKEVARYWRHQRKFWFGLSGYEFEKEMGAIYGNLGYRARVTKGSGDGGIDIILKKDGLTEIVQCKAYKNPAGPKEVRELFGVFSGNSKYDKSVLVCLGGFTKGAKDFARGKPIRLLECDDVIRLYQRSEELTSN